METTTLNYLLPYLRLKLGDTNSSNYRYLDEWLLIALKLSIKKLQRYWYSKYLLDSSENVFRNTDFPYFDYAEPPVIETKDEYVIIAMAAFIILDGSLENSAWDAVSWKDAEIAYSNLESYRSRDAGLNRLLDELKDLLLPPTKKLARPKKGHLPGYIDNIFERDGKL